MKNILTLITLITLLLLALPLGAQNTDVWQELLAKEWDADDLEQDSWEETYEMLAGMAENPLNINTATKEDLEQFPFLSQEEITDILEYLYTYGGMKTTAELAMVRSLTAEKQQLLRQFIFIGETPRRSRFPSVKNILKYGKSNLLFTANIPTYEREGDRNGYLGYPYRHSLRYKFSYGDYLKVGLVGAQDAGEPFFSGGNGMGYDFYSFYIVARKLGRVKALALGRYRMKLGMGLVMNNSFALGKSMTLSSMERQSTDITAHSSRSENNYLQGAAATVGLTKSLDVTAFVSYRDIDATLNKDGTIRTILSTGYHRTPAEMQKKNNASQLAAGGNLRYSRGAFDVGLSAVYTSLSRELVPNTTQAYRRYYAAGTHFYNMSLDYGYVSGKLSFRGETATGGSGAWATVNMLTFRPSTAISMMLLQRFYSYRYCSLFAKSFSEGGRVQNESGVYLGVDWHPSRRLSVRFYTDYAYFPWQRYQVSTSSHVWDNMLSASYTMGRWTLAARYRLKIKERDNATKTALATKTDQRGRLALTFDNGTLSCKTQLDAANSSFSGDSFGWMVTENVAFKLFRHLSANVSVGYFKTDDYDSRLYAYERGMLYDFSFPSYYGEGLRYALLLRAALGKMLTLALKVGTTNYFDRSHVGTGLQQVDGSALTDIGLQVGVKF